MVLCQFGGKWRGFENGSILVVDQVRKVAEQNGVDVSEQIQELEQRAKQVRARVVGLNGVCLLILKWHIF